MFSWSWVLFLSPLPPLPFALTTLFLLIFVCLHITPNCLDFTDQCISHGLIIVLSISSSTTTTTTIIAVITIIIMIIITCCFHKSDNDDWQWFTLAMSASIFNTVTPEIRKIIVMIVSYTHRCALTHTHTHTHTHTCTHTHSQTYTHKHTHTHIHTHTDSRFSAGQPKTLSPLALWASRFWVQLLVKRCQPKAMISFSSYSRPSHL